MTIGYTIKHESVDTPSIKVTHNFPVDWARFSLTSLMSELERQAVATFANARAQVQPILDIDTEMMEKVPEIFSDPSANELLGIMLFTRMFSVLRAAARLVFAGQQYEARSVLRSALECGVYGWALIVNDELRGTWKRRDESEEARKKARNAFAWSGLQKSLQSASQSLADTVGNLYESLIDLGAHPNPGGILDGQFVTKDADGHARLNTVFGGGDRESISIGLRDLLDVTHAGFDLLRLALPERMKKSGVGSRVSAIFNAAVCNHAVEGG